MNRRTFLKTNLLTGGVFPFGFNALAEGEKASPLQRKFILGAPLTHSDWMLKPGIAWGEEGVRHLLDACKACGWSKIYWRVSKSETRYLVSYEKLITSSSRVRPLLVASFHGAAGLARSGNHRSLGTDFCATR